jgi:hypothetical protein
VDTEPTEEKPAPSPGLNLLGRLDIERLARLLGACALALYVIGFIAVNGYLFQLDVTDFGLVRARFVYTGALLATSGVLPYVVLRTSFVKLELSHPPHGARNVYKLRVTDWVRLIAVLLAIPAILIVALIVINNYSGPKGWLKAAIVILPVYIIGLVLCYIVDRRFLSALGRTGERDAQRLLLRGVHLSGAEDVQRETQRDVRLLREVHLSRAAFLALYCFAVYIGVFMALSYPEVPEQFGGGRPSYVRLLIKTESISGAAELGIPMSQSGLSCKVALVYEGSDAYVIELPPKRIVRLNKDMVSATITKQSAPPTLRC